MSSSQRLEVKNYRMGEFLMVKHLAQYGRPMWLTHLFDDENRKIALKRMVKLAKAKLLTNKSFKSNNTDHVFTILSQRICLQSTPEAIPLADRSVANHSVSHSSQRSRHTHSPSEPILSLGAISALYDAYEDGPLKPHTLGPVLTTFTQDLFKAGLIKGELGEVAARFLLIVARDFTAIKQEDGDFLKPVRLLDVLDSLLCKDKWKEGKREEFETPFAGAYVNVTEENLPDVPDEDLLANLWSRNAILQCSHNQGSHDFVAAVYFGDITDSAVFDPKKLVPFFGQFKHKTSVNTSAERKLRPIGIPRVANLPHLALLMELGTDTPHKGGRSIRKTISSAITDGAFENGQKALLDAKTMLLELKGKGANEADIEAQKKEVEEKQNVLDASNQYLIAVRGTSPYGILKEAMIVTEFEGLLELVDRLDYDIPEQMQTMMPLRRFNRDTAYTTWMHRFVADPEAMLVDMN